MRSPCFRVPYALLQLNTVNEAIVKLSRTCLGCIK